MLKKLCEKKSNSIIYIYAYACLLDYKLFITQNVRCRVTLLVSKRGAIYNTLIQKHRHCHRISVI